MEEIDRIKLKFKLQPHPEGGYFGAGYRSPEFIRGDGLPNRYDGARNLYSSIYFMVTTKHSSKFHKLKTDELWHFYQGDSLTLHLISESGKYTTIEMGNEKGKERYQYLVKKNVWMAASCNSISAGYSLAGCTLSPGFEYQDFELGKKDDLLEAFPDLKNIISSYS